jgi:hypothetical protein
VGVTEPGTRVCAMQTVGCIYFRRRDMRFTACSSSGAGKNGPGRDFAMTRRKDKSALIAKAQDC